MFPLIILAGPTASGKSETAVALAEHLDTEIINADSMQVYKYFDIGTAKPSRETRQRVVHHLIDILEPDEEFTAFDFKVRALERIRELTRRNKVPILVGGTGLYLKVLTQDYDCAVQVSPEIRERVKAEILCRGSESMHTELAGVDAPSAARIRPTDPLRIERALTVYYQTGKRFSDFHAPETPPERDFDIHYFVLERDRKQLYADIDRRVDDMIRKGLLDEVRLILDKGFGKELKPFQSIGYAQMVSHLEGKIPLDRAIYEIKRDTRHYAKRQITWFKKVPGAISVPVGAGDTPLALRDKIMTLLPAGLLCMFFLFVPTVWAGSLTYNEGVRFFDKGDYPKAMNHFQVIRKSAPDTPEGKRASYLIGKTHAAQQEYKEAVEAFNSSAYPEIKDYVHFELAQSHFSLHEYAQALEQVTLLLEKFPQSCLSLQAELFRAEVLSKLDKNDQAARFLAQAIERFSRKPRDLDFAPHLPQLIFKSAEFMEAAQQSKQAYSLYRELYINYPDHPVMSKALPNMKRLNAETPLLSEEELSTRIQGLLSGVRYEQVIEEINQFRRREGKAALSPRFYFYLASAHKGFRQRAQANEILLSFLKGYPGHQRVQEADYMVARNYWNLNQNENAIRYFREALRGGTDSEWFIKSHFFLGRLYEDDKQYDLANQQYTVLADLTTSHEYKETASWRLAWIHYKTGKYEQSFNQFKSNVERIPNGQLTDANMFWMGKSAERLEKHDMARGIYADLYKTYPYSYYGLRARNKLLEGKEGQKADVPAPSDEVAAMPDSSSEEPFHYVRAIEMIEMGFNENARLEVRQIEKAVKKNLTGVIWMTNLYNRAKAYSESFRLLTLYKDLKTARGERDLPLRFWKNLYPAVYSDSIRLNSRNHKIDPSLVRGVIHQESMFDTKSLSPAGARGLMQLMPETGKRMFSNEQKPFVADALFDPDTNIELGVRYLSQLIQQADGNAAHVLISYNAGPDVLKRWLQQFQDLKDPDEFLESVPFPETRVYVRRVLRNYEIYKYLYPNGTDE